MKTRYLSAVLALFLLISVIGCAAPAQAPSTAPPAELTPTPEPTPSPSPTPTPTPSPVSEIQATVTEVIDGDTIKVSIAGAIYDVRYIGVDTPELNDKRPQFSALAQEAARLNRQLVEGKVVQLEKDISETDHYGRLLRYVYVDDTFVNAELVRQGLASAKAYEPDTKYRSYFEELEAKARQDKIGIWQEVQPSVPISVQNVQITYIFYDGIVPRVESDEYVEITNLGDKPQDLTGCLLMDISEGYPSFIFPSYILAPGESIRVYTNEIHPEWGGFSFGYSKAIWNNTEPDVAVLYDNQGNLISQKSY
jgi:endonuclease YncB( thermonuclease family)